jgi:hypothetical protein
VRGKNRRTGSKRWRCVESVKCCLFYFNAGLDELFQHSLLKLGV